MAALEADVHGHMQDYLGQSPGKAKLKKKKEKREGSKNVNRNEVDEGLGKDKNADQEEAALVD